MKKVLFLAALFMLFSCTKEIQMPTTPTKVLLSVQAIDGNWEATSTLSQAIPSSYTCDDEMNDSIPEKINGEEEDEMGVKFDVWLARDPKQPIPDQENDWKLDLFWERSFYPDIYTLANDLYKRGLIEEGEYIINIDW